MKAVVGLAFLATFAWASAGMATPSGSKEPIAPIFTANVVSYSIPAINYEPRSDDTNVAFRGTALMPQAKGRAKVEGKQTVIDVDAKFEGLDDPQRLGPEYLTYVLWAITPEGRPANLGELMRKGDRSGLQIRTELQAFGMFVTAEPYFAVTRPSNAVILENVLESDTTGRIDSVEAKCELLERGFYRGDATLADLDPKLPLSLKQAHNALRIARAHSSDRLAEASHAKAQELLKSAEAEYRAEGESKQLTMLARQATQTAEDARIVASKRAEQERLAAERRSARDRVASAEAEAEQEANRRESAEQDTAAADKARLEAQRAALAADRLRHEAELQRNQAEQEKEALRAELQRQLNLVLETRETTRGLVVGMSDVFFATDQWSLTQGAREKLSKLAGILLTHPGLVLQVEGHTDSRASDEYNQRLSERRAGSVRDYLVSQGIAATAITARGFGETMPIASNDTADGQQMNRRVELIVSGEVIGVKISSLPQRSGALALVR